MPQRGEDLLRNGVVRADGENRNANRAQSIAKLRQATNWEPRIPIEQTLHRLFDSWRERIIAS